MSYANANRDYKIFEEFAYYIRPFELNGKFYAFDVVTQIPTYIHIMEAKLHDVKAMDEIKSLNSS